MKNKLMPFVFVMIFFTATNYTAQIARSDEKKGNRAETGIISTIQDMNKSRAAHTAIVLDNGKVLIACGSTQAEIFDPAKNTFEVAPEKFETTRLFSTATLLADGRVLIVGGYDNQNAVSRQAWFYKS